MHRYLAERGGSAPRTAVIEEGMRHVPGGMAFRVGHQKRTIDSGHRNFGVRSEPTTKDAASLRRAGANKVVCNSLYYERKAKRIEQFDGPDGTPWLRLIDHGDS
jgi:hypothetical protein